jgi:hypothetical protein
MECLLHFLFPPLFLLQEDDDSPDQDLDLSDDEELHQAFDIHSLIISNMAPEDDEHLYTADEVISEIEGMMEVGNISLLTLPSVLSVFVFILGSVKLDFNIVPFEFDVPHFDR